MGRAEVEQVETDHDLTQEKLKEILLRRRFLPVYSRDGGFFFSPDANGITGSPIIPADASRSRTGPSNMAFWITGAARTF
jgi:hypothetical protein